MSAWRKRLIGVLALLLIVGVGCSAGETGETVEGVMHSGWGYERDENGTPLLLVQVHLVTDTTAYKLDLDPRCELVNMDGRIGQPADGTLIVRTGTALLYNGARYRAQGTLEPTGEEFEELPITRVLTHRLELLDGE